MVKTKFRSAFTIVELIVVISIIAILAGIVTVSYGAWRTSTGTASLKIDLVAAASAMESARTFNNTYPSFIPTSFIQSEGNTVTLTISGTKSYCINGTSTVSGSTSYYIDNITKDSGAIQGTCETRVFGSSPVAVSGVTIGLVTAGQATISWNLSPLATSYIAQCSSDPVFIVGINETTVGPSADSAIVSGLPPLSTFFCRVRATNSVGASQWSESLSSTATNAFGSLAVGTSIEGYWTASPQGFLPENGAAVSRTTYADLFAVIGTTYGAGNGSTTFNLPDSRGRTSVNQSTDVEFATIGQWTGSKTEALTVDRIPSHTHTQVAHTHNFPANPSGSEVGGFGLRSDGNGFGNRVLITGAGSTVVSSGTATNNNSGSGLPHNIIQPSITKRFAIKYTTADSVATNFSPGTSIHGYWSSAPTGYLLEDGSAVSRTTYADLFAVIGTTYGVGNSLTTFNLPDSRGRVSVNINPSDTEFDSMGERPGSKREALTIAQLPSHTHTQSSGSHNVSIYTSGSEAGGFGLTTSNNGFNNRVYVTGCCAATSSTEAVNQPTGGGQTTNVIQPSIVTRSAIKYSALSGTVNTTSTGSSKEGYWPSTPTGYLLEDGSAVSRTTYADLFAVIGTTHGAGNGSTTFNLPDSRGRVSVNINPSDTEFDSMGERPGSKTHVLTIDQMAAHTHLQDSHSHSVNNMMVSSAEAAGFSLVSPNNGFNNRVFVTGCCTAVSSSVATNQVTGGGQAFNTIQPSIVKRVVMKF